MRQAIKKEADGPCPTAVIYIRVSSDAQVDGTSLGTQRDACRACAERLKLAVLSEHADEGKSAKTVVGRDALAAAVAAAVKTRSVFIVYKFDRLSRNLGDGYELRDVLAAKGCRIVSATEGEATLTPVSKAMYAIMMAFAELDNDMRTERCTAGMRARARQGAWTGNAPVGFRIVRNPDKMPVLVPDGDQSEVLRSAFRAFISGAITKSGLIKRLMSAGLPASTITRIIRSPVYGGIIRNKHTGGEDIPAAFPGLITADEYYIMEHKLRSGRRVNLKDNPAFPYTGVVFCASCGHPVRSGYTRNNGRSFGYYFCVGKGHGKIRRDDLHAQASAMLAELGKIGPFLELLKKAVESRDVAAPYKDERERHRRAVARLEPQLARLRAALLDGTFGKEEYAAEQTRINGMLAESREWLAANAESADRRGKCIDLLMEVFRDPVALTARLTVPQLKSLVRIIFGRFSLTIEKRIEPPQDSVFKILTTAKTYIVPQGVRPSS